MSSSHPDENPTLTFSLPPDCNDIINELKRLDKTIHSIAHQIKFALEAMSEALERMEVRIYNVETERRKKSD